MSQLLEVPVTFVSLFLISCQTVVASEMQTESYFFRLGSNIVLLYKLPV